MIDISPLITREMQAYQEEIIASGVRCGSMAYTVLGIRYSFSVAEKYGIRLKYNWFENVFMFFALMIAHSPLKWPSNLSGN